MSGTAAPRKFTRVHRLILFLLGVGLYLVVVNQNRQRAIPLDSIEFIHWDVAAGAYVSQVDPQIITAYMPGYYGFLNNIEIRGNFSGRPAPEIFYTSDLEEAFSPEKSFWAPYAYWPNSDLLRVGINKMISGKEKFRVDLGDEEGFVISGLQSVAYDFLFVVNLNHLLLVALFMLLLAYADHFTPRRLKNAFKQLVEHITNFKRYTYLLGNLVKKDITTKYRRSALGLLWSVLNPLLMMAVMSAVFKNLFRVQVENFAMYYLTGSLVFGFMSEATSSSMMSMLGASALIKKVYIPKYIFPLEKCLFALINAMFSFAAVLIMMPVLGIHFSWSVLLFFVPLFYTFVFSVGFGMVVASLTVFFRDISHLYSVWLTAWMYLTPVIYPVGILPRGMMGVVKANPMYYFVDYFRQVVMYGAVPDFSVNVICAAYSFGFLALGLAVLKKAQDRFILYL